MTHRWRMAALVCVAASLHISRTHAIEIGGETSVVIQDLSDVDIAVGRGEAPRTAFGLKLFTQPVPGVAGSDDLAGGEQVEVRKAFSFLGDEVDGGLIDIVAAVRNDPDHSSQVDDAGAAVNEWTGSLDEKDPALAPPAGRSSTRQPRTGSSGGMVQPAP